MSRTKLPALTALVYRGGDIPIDVLAERELRAVRALISAAGKLATYLQLEVPADEWMPVDDRMARAYVRLERLSSPPSRRGSLRQPSTVEGNDKLPANSRRTARGTKETR